MMHIPLTQGQVVLVDDADYPLLSYTFPEVVSHLTDFLRRPLIKVKIRCRTVWK